MAREASATVLAMAPIKLPNAHYGKVCKHYHVSGRRCLMRTSGTFCAVHIRTGMDPCTECYAMAKAFGMKLP